MQTVCENLYPESELLVLIPKKQLKWVTKEIKMDCSLSIHTCSPTKCSYPGRKSCENGDKWETLSQIIL